MEKISQLETTEKISKEDAILSLENNPPNFDLLKKWINEQQKIVAVKNDVMEEVLLSVEIAEIYKKVGLLYDAYNSFIDAADQAINEGKKASLLGNKKLSEKLLSLGDSLQEQADNLL